MAADNLPHPSLQSVTKKLRKLLSDDNESAIAEVAEALKHKDWRIRRSAAKSISQASSSAYKSLLQEALSSERNRYVVAALKEALSGSPSSPRSPIDASLVRSASSAEVYDAVTRLLKRKNPSPKQIAQLIDSLIESRLQTLRQESEIENYLQLAADIAHQIDTHLATANFLLRELDAPTASAAKSSITHSELVGKLRLTFQTLQRNTRDLRTLSLTDEKLTWTEAFLPDLIRVAVQRVTEVDQANHAIQVDADDAVLETDQAVLVEALVNLLRNATEATPADGSISIRGRVLDRVVEIAISDRGTGMTSEFLVSAKKRFVTTKRDQGGTGLGIPIAIRYVEDLLRGRLAIISTPGTGTDCIVTLPQFAS